MGYFTSSRWKLALPLTLAIAALGLLGPFAIAQTARESVDQNAPWPDHVLRRKDGTPVAQRETGHTPVGQTIYYRVTLCAGSSLQWTPPTEDLQRLGLKGPQASAGNFKSTGDKVKGVNDGTGGRAKFEGKATLNKDTNKMGPTNETLTYDITDSNKTVAHIVLKVHIIPCDTPAERGFNTPRLETTSPPVTKGPPVKKKSPGAPKQPGTPPDRERNQSG